MMRSTADLQSYAGYESIAVENTDAELHGY